MKAAFDKVYPVSQGSGGQHYFLNLTTLRGSVKYQVQIVRGITNDLLQLVMLLQVMVEPEKHTLIRLGKLF